MRRGLVLEFVVLAAIWGSSFLFMHFGAAEFGAWATAGLRVAVASLVLVPLLLIKGQWPAFRQQAGAIMLGGLFNSGVPFALYAYALHSISTGLSSVLNATTPLFGALIAWLWLKDRPGLSRSVGLLVGFGGIVLLSWDKASFHAGGSGWAVLACLGSTCLYGISASYTKKYLAGVPALAIAAGSQLGSTLALALPTLWFWPTQTPSLQAWSAIVVVGVLCTAIAYIMFFHLIEVAGPSKTLTVTFLVPLFAVVYGVVLLNETITPHMVMGAVVVMLGVLLASGLLKPGARR